MGDDWAARCLTKAEGCQWSVLTGSDSGKSPIGCRVLELHNVALRSNIKSFILSIPSLVSDRMRGPSSRWYKTVTTTLESSLAFDPR
jgi:hypothetical protein